MDVKKAIEERRSYRALAHVEITEDIIKELVEALQLAPSCFNNQPWRYVFVYDKKMLEAMKPALSKGNEWIHAASLIIAVLSKKDMDCVVKGREYFHFDVGLSVGMMMLRATELGLVAHAIAGYDEKKTREILNIPDDMSVITLVNVGKHLDKMTPMMTDKQKKDEKARPERLPVKDIIYRNKFSS